MSFLNDRLVAVFNRVEDSTLMLWLNKASVRGEWLRHAGRMFINEGSVFEEVLTHLRELRYM